MNESLQPKAITFGTKPANLPNRDGCDVRVMTKSFALVDVTQVNLDRGNFDCGDRIAKRNTRVRVCPSID